MDGTKNATTNQAKFTNTPNTELDYPKRAEKYKLRLTEEILPPLKSKLKIFLIDRMQRHNYVSSNDLDDRDFKEALDLLHSDSATAEEKQLLVDAGFEKVRLKPEKATQKIKALIPVFFNVEAIQVEEGWYEYEKLRTMSEPPEEENFSKVYYFSKVALCELTREKLKNLTTSDEQENAAIACIENGCPLTLAWLMTYYKWTELKLFHGKIEFSKKRIDTLFQALALCPQVTTLDLSSDAGTSYKNYNDLQERGVALHFFEMLEENSTLKELNLSRVSGIFHTEHEVGKFCSAVNASKLTSVKLESCKIIPAQAEKLWDGIKQNKKLTNFIINAYYSDLTAISTKIDQLCAQNLQQQSMVNLANASSTSTSSSYVGSSRTPDQDREFYNTAIRTYLMNISSSDLKNKTENLLKLGNAFVEIKILDEELAEAVGNRIKELIDRGVASAAQVSHWQKNAAKYCVSFSAVNEKLNNLTYLLLQTISVSKQPQYKESRQEALTKLGELRLFSAKHCPIPNEGEFSSYNIGMHKGSAEEILAVINKKNATQEDFDAIYNVALDLISKGDITQNNPSGYIRSGIKFLKELAPKHAGAACFMGMLYQQITLPSLSKDTKLATSFEIVNGALDWVQEYIQKHGVKSLPEEKDSLPDCAARHFIFAIKQGHQQAGQQLKKLVDKAEFGTLFGFGDTFSSSVISEIGELYSDQKVSLSTGKAEAVLKHLTGNQLANAACVLATGYMEQKKYNEAIKYVGVAINNYKETGNKQDLNEAKSLDTIKTVIKTTLNQFDQLKKENLIDGQGLHEISLIYSEGKIFEPDYMKANTYLEAAAEKGNRDATNKLKGGGKNSLNTPNTKQIDENVLEQEEDDQL